MWSLRLPNNDNDRLLNGNKYHFVSTFAALIRRKAQAETSRGEEN
jgi:hypothetical protein